MARSKLEFAALAVAFITHCVGVVARVLAVPLGLFDWLEAKVKSQEKTHRFEVQGQESTLQEEESTILFGSPLSQSSLESPHESPVQRASIAYEKWRPNYDHVSSHPSGSAESSLEEEEDTIGQTSIFESREVFAASNERSKALERETQDRQHLLVDALNRVRTPP